MITATKCGNKWILGFEDYLDKIMTSAQNLALEVAYLSGQYREARGDLAVLKQEVKSKEHLAPPTSYSTVTFHGARSENKDPIPKKNPCPRTAQMTFRRLIKIKTP